MVLSWENGGATRLFRQGRRRYIVTLILQEKLRPVVRRHFQKELQDLRLFIRFADNVNTRDMFRRITDHGWTLEANEGTCSDRRKRSVEFTIVRLRLRIGIRHRGEIATRCKCRIINASVSRLGFGSCWISASKFCCLTKSDSSSITPAKDFHMALVNNDSDKERRKSFTTPQIKCMSL